MPIRADQLREKEDFQKLILERLEEDNKFRIRPSTVYKPGLAMDTEVLLEFLEDTQHDEMERLRRMYKDRTNDTVINPLGCLVKKVFTAFDLGVHPSFQQLPLRSFQLRPPSPWR